MTRRTMLASAAALGAAATVSAAAPAALAGPGAPAAPEAAALGGRAVFPACDWTAAERQDRRWVMSAGLTEDEADCWLLVARAAGKFFALPVIHPSVLPEVVEAVHVLQDKLLMRPTYRRYLEAAGAGSAADPGARAAYVTPAE